MAAPWTPALWGSLRDCIPLPAFLAVKMFSLRGVLGPPSIFPGEKPGDWEARSLRGQGYNDPQRLPRPEVTGPVLHQTGLADLREEMQRYWSNSSPLAPRTPQPRAPAAPGTPSPEHPQP